MGREKKKGKDSLKGLKIDKEHTGKKNSEESV